MDKKTVAIVPGSFDPITVGHIFIVKEAAKRYDKVFVAVMINSDKKYKFSLEQRKNITEATLKGMSNIEVISSDGWLYDLANTLSADAIVKGYRNEVDLEYERKMAEFNLKHAPNTKTVLIKSPEELSSVSSTLVREKMNAKSDVSELLSAETIAEIEKILQKN